MFLPKTSQATKRKLVFDRILTPKFTKDVDELKNYDLDLREILSENAKPRPLTMMDRLRIALMEEDIQLGLRPAPEVMPEKFAELTW